MTDAAKEQYVRRRARCLSRSPGKCGPTARAGGVGALGLPPRPGRPGGAEQSAPRAATARCIATYAAARPGSGRAPPPARVRGERRDDLDDGPTKREVHRDEEHEVSEDPEHPLTVQGGANDRQG